MDATDSTGNGFFSLCKLFVRIVALDECITRENILMELGAGKKQQIKFSGAEM